MDYSFSPTPSSGSMMVAAPFDTELNVFQSATTATTGPQPLAAKDITYVAIPELASTRIAQVEAGQAHILDGVSPQLYRASRKPSRTLELGIARETSFLEMIMMNTTKPPFDNQLVRQALMYSIDAQELIDIGLRGRRSHRPLAAASGGPEVHSSPSSSTTSTPRSRRRCCGRPVTTRTTSPCEFQLGVVEWALRKPAGALVRPERSLKEGGFDPLLLVDSIDARWVSDIMKPEEGSDPAKLRRVGGDHRLRGVQLRRQTDCSAVGGAAGRRTPASRRPGVPAKLERVPQRCAWRSRTSTSRTSCTRRPTRSWSPRRVPYRSCSSPSPMPGTSQVAGYQMPQTLGMTLFGVHPSGK